MSERPVEIADGIQTLVKARRAVPLAIAGSTRFVPLKTSPDIAMALVSRRRTRCRRRFEPCARSVGDLVLIRASMRRSRRWNCRRLRSTCRLPSRS